MDAKVFQVDPSSGVPIYRQLIDQVKSLIAGGWLSPGDSLPSVREMAQQLQVNPMTISKAYARLERDQILERQRGKAMRVRPLPVKANEKECRARARPALVASVRQARQLGLGDQQILEEVHRVLRQTSEVFDE